MKRFRLVERSNQFSNISLFFLTLESGILLRLATSQFFPKSSGLETIPVLAIGVVLVAFNVRRSRSRRRPTLPEFMWLIPYLLLVVLTIHVLSPLATSSLTPPLSSLPVVYYVLFFSSMGLAYFYVGRFPDSLLVYIPITLSALLSSLPGLFVYQIGMGVAAGTDESIFVGYTRRMALLGYERFDASYSGFSLGLFLSAFQALTGVDTFLVNTVFGSLMLYVVLPATLLSIGSKLFSRRAGLIAALLLPWAYAFGWLGFHFTPFSLGLVWLAFVVYTAMIHVGNGSSSVTLVLAILASYLVHPLIGLASSVIMIVAVAIRRKNLIVRMLLIPSIGFVLFLPSIFAFIFKKARFPHEWSFTGLLLGELASHVYLAVILGLPLLASSIYAFKKVRHRGPGLRLFLFGIVVLYLFYLLLSNEIVYDLFGPGRVLVMISVLDLPLLALLIDDKIPSFSRLSVLRPSVRIVVSRNSKFSIRLQKKHWINISSAFLVITGLVTVALLPTVQLYYYNNYDYAALPFPPITRGDIEAIKKIDALAGPNGYVTLGDWQTQDVGVSLYGLDTSRGHYTSYWVPEKLEVYGKLLGDPSEQVIEQIKGVARQQGVNNLFVVINTVRYNIDIKNLLDRVSSSAYQVYSIKDTVVIWIRI